MFRNMDWIELVITIGASLLCITFHEVSHGFVAYKLGDNTAKDAGRLTLNPIRHIDLVGLFMMIVAKVGWAKAVPVNPKNFKNPKRDMAITALAGPISNFLLAFVTLILAYLAQIALFYTGIIALYYIGNFLYYVTILSIGLGVFNLIPIPPLDGSKVLFSILPERFYFAYMKYERFGFILVWVLAISGVSSGIISSGIDIIFGALNQIVTAMLNPFFA